MPKKRSDKKTEPSTFAAVSATLETSVVFPDLSSKTDLECRTVLEDQILVIDVGPRLLRLSSNDRQLCTYPGLLLAGRV